MENEPVLAMQDIQGIVVPGFFKPHQTLLGLQFPRGDLKIGQVKRFLEGISGEVSTADQTLCDRRKHRAMQSRIESEATALLAVAITFAGLRELTTEAGDMPSEAFKVGLAGRSLLLGDPSHGRGSAATWKIGGPGRELDALLVIAGNNRPSVSDRADHLADVARTEGLAVLYREDGGVRPDCRGHEHFGFRDGISQPGIRGRASAKNDDFITERHIAGGQVPEAHLFGYPGQDLVWPGAFVLGQPGVSPDPLIPGLPTPAIPKWTANGSFLVFRRLVQDVGLFWRTMRKLARKLSKEPGFKKIDENWLAARLVGRWPSGAPVNRVPDGDNRSLGGERRANNHFRFDSNSARLLLASGYDDNFPMSTADPAGITCPWGAHIRKVNTRDSASDTGGRDSTYKRRLLRVGVPFGPPLENRFAGKKQDKNFGKRGLLFLSIQASIEDQFEFLMARWMGDPSRPRALGGHDLLVGQNDAPGEERERRCVLFGAETRQAELRTRSQWVIPSGGGYFFVPSLSALREVLCR